MGSRCQRQYYKVEENDKVHRLYSSRNTDNESYVDLSSDSILSSLAEIENGTSYYFSNQANDIFSLFVFLADNTSVEWELARYSDGYSLHTDHEKDGVSKARYYKSNPIATIHSHPDEGGDTSTYSKKISSMGYSKTGVIPSSDWANKIKDVVENGRISEMSYVYFPSGKQVYYVGYYKPYYIKTLNRGYRGLYFGTLNNK